MSVVMTGILVAWAIFAWWGLTSALPQCSTSRARYRLWALRDRLTDEIRAGDFSNVAQARRMVSELEAGIQSIHEFSFVKLYLINRLYRDLPPRRELLVDFTVLGKEDRDALERYRMRLVGELARQALIARPSGWIALLVCAPLIVPHLAYQTLRGSLGGPFIASLWREIKNRLYARDDGTEVETALAMIHEKAKPVPLH